MRRRLPLFLFLVVLVGCGSIRARAELDAMRTQMADLRGQVAARESQVSAMEANTATILRQLEAARASGSDTGVLEKLLADSTAALRDVRADAAAARSKIDTLRPALTEKRVQVSEEKKQQAQDGLGMLQGLLVGVLGLSSLGSGLAGRKVG